MSASKRRSLLSLFLGGLLVFLFYSLPAALPEVRERVPVPLRASHALPAASAPRSSAFNPLEWPAIVINNPEASSWRKWSEAQLAGLGYASYTRLNGRVLPASNRSCEDCWQDGLLMAHAGAWERITAYVPRAGEPEPRGFLICEDDVTFHADFVRVWARYDAELRAAPLSVVYVGQWSHYEDKPGLDLVEVLSDAAVPWTTHAYIVTPAAAALLARFAQFVLARGASPLRAAPFVFEAYLKDAPWRLSAADTKIDFLMRTAHHYFFRDMPPLRGAALPQWRALHSTPAVPAALGSTHQWTRNAEINFDAASGDCRRGAPDFAPCEAPNARVAKCGIPSGRLPVMGTGLAYQNNCKGNPFMLRVWTGEATDARAPTCVELARLIAPGAGSDPAPPCKDEPDSTSSSPTPGGTAEIAPPRPPRRGVFTVDNRPLENDLASAGYSSLSAAINFHYALHHGYNFTLLQPRFSMDALPAAAAAVAAGGCPPKSPFSPAELQGALEEVAQQPAGSQVKDSVTAWHPSLNHFRAASWAKLPLLWHALEGYAAENDAALYLDSDAIVTRREADFESVFSAPPEGKLTWGDDASKASLVFGVNAPYDAAYPCAGVMMLRGGGGARDLLRAWWDTPAHARRHAYEQDALWGLLQRWQAGVCPNPYFNMRTVAVVATRQFPAAANPKAYGENAPLEQDRYSEFSEGSWIHHTQWWMGGRVAIMCRRIAELGLSSSDFSGLIDRIRSEHTVGVDVVQAAVDMHEATCSREALEPPCSAFYS